MALLSLDIQLKLLSAIPYEVYVMPSTTYNNQEFKTPG